MDTSEWKADPELQKTEDLDILLLFEEYNKQLEKEHDVAVKKAKMERARTARKARDDFKVGFLLL